MILFHDKPIFNYSLCKIMHRAQPVTNYDVVYIKYYTIKLYFQGCHIIKYARCF